MDSSKPSASSQPQGTSSTTKPPGGNLGNFGLWIVMPEDEEKVKKSGLPYRLCPPEVAENIREMDAQAEAFKEVVERDSRNEELYGLDPNELSLSSRNYGRRTIYPRTEQQILKYLFAQQFDYRAYENDVV